MLIGRLFALLQASIVERVSFLRLSFGLLILILISFSGATESRDELILLIMVWKIILGSFVS